jgi:hypothetical protein
VVGLEQVRHAKAHVSDGDDPDGGSTHVRIDCPGGVWSRKS